MHPARLAILEALRWSEECVCHLEACLGLQQAYISQQLAVLRRVGLIADRRDGLNIYYRIAQPEVLQLLDTVRILAGVPGDQPPREPRRPDCPCPRCRHAVPMLITLHEAYHKNEDSHG